MFKGDETPEDIIRLVLDRITAMPDGLREAFAHDGRIQLYTGPNNDYTKFLIGPSPKKYRNSDRAGKQAQEWDATRLDDTNIGQFLFVENDIYEHFWALYNNPALVNDAAKEVMTFVSALWIRAAHGDVKTAVCGADRERVLYETEIEGLCDRKAYPSEAEFLVDCLLDNKDITSINGTPIAVFRALRKSKGAEAVYDRICLAELRERKERAVKTGDKADYEDYLDRLELYRVDKAERVYKSTPVAARPPVYQELALPKPERLLFKQKRVEDFEMAAKATTARATGPTVPTVGTEGPTLCKPHP